MVFAFKAVVFGVKVLAKMKPGSNVIFKLGAKGAAWGLLAVTPGGEVLVFVALSSLSGIAIGIAATFIISKLADRGLRYLWDEQLVQSYPDVINTTEETQANIATGQFSREDIPGLLFRPTRKRILGELIEETVVTELGRELNPVEQFVLEAVLIGFNLLPSFVSIPLQLFVVQTGIQSQAGEFPFN